METKRGACHVNHMYRLSDFAHLTIQPYNAYESDIITKIAVGELINFELIGWHITSNPLLLNYKYLKKKIVLFKYIWNRNMLINVFKPKTCEFIQKVIKYVKICILNICTMDRICIKF